jgi:spermidine/putrescine transport system permease protein
VTQIQRLSTSSPRPEALGLGVLLLVSGGFILIAAEITTGVVAYVVGAMIALSLVAYAASILRGTSEDRRSIAPYALLKPGALWLSIFFLAPLWALLVMSLSSKESRFDFFPSFTWEWENYREAFTRFRPQFIRSFMYAGIATVLTILIGFPIAYVIAFRGGKYRMVLLGLVVIPFFTSYLIRTLAWTTLLNDNGPVLSAIDTLQLKPVLEWLRIVDDGRLLSTPTAVIGGLTYNFLPFMILPIYVSLEKIDTRLMDAAMDLYSSASGAFRKVVLPLSVPGIFAGSLLVFIPASGDFVNAQFLGGPNTTMIGNSIQDQYLKQLNYPVASAMSFVLMVIITIGVLVYTKFMGTEELA